MNFIFKLNELRQDTKYGKILANEFGYLQV